MDTFPEKSEPVAVAQADQVIPTDAQTFKGVPAVAVILLDEEVFGTAFQSGFDALPDGQIALAQLRELHGLAEEGV